MRSPFVGFAVAVLGLASGCVIEPEVATVGSNRPLSETSEIRLHIERSMLAEGDVRGIDADQDGNLWIAYNDREGRGYFDIKPVTLVHWNPSTRQRLATFTFADTYVPVSGLAIVGKEIWVSHHGQADEPHHIRVVDATTGAVVRQVANTVNTISIGHMGNDQALISDMREKFLVVDAVPGTFVEHATSTDPWFSQRGITSRPGEIWISHDNGPTMVFDSTGNFLNSVDTPLLRSAEHLAFDRDQLLVTKGGQITWVSIEDVASPAR